MNLQEYVGKWYTLFDLNELRRVLSLLKGNFSPSIDKIFDAFHHCDYYNCKVVIIGQDPYPQKDVATGIAFANNSTKLSPSLEVIKDNVLDFEFADNCYNFDSTLLSWESQGVLLINAALTVEINKPLSHTMLWRKFISSFLENLSNRNPGLIYVVFGSTAQTLIPYLSKESHIIKCEHPAYFVRMHSQMPKNFFLKLKNKVKFYFNEDINFYTKKE